MSNCRWDRDAEDYLIDGEPCRHDDYGDPTRHCTARRTCAQHIGPDELTCARCVGRTRADLRVIRDLAALMLPAALGAGIDSEAANLAGPATDVRTWHERRTAMKTYLLTWEAVGRINAEQYAHARATMEDDDEEHPYTVLTRWQMMLSEDYAHPLPDKLTIDGAGDYLERNLNRLAQDDEQDFPLFAREIRKCRNHLERVLRTAMSKQRGAPCPECTSPDSGVGPRLVREYGHWCDDEDCEKLHYADDAADRWVCPRNRAHEWTVKAYTDYIEERQTA